MVSTVRTMYINDRGLNSSQIHSLRKWSLFQNYLDSKHMSTLCTTLLNSWFRENILYTSLGYVGIGVYVSTDNCCCNNDKGSITQCPLSGALWSYDKQYHHAPFKSIPHTHRNRVPEATYKELMDQSIVGAQFN